MRSLHVNVSVLLAAALVGALAAIACGGGGGSIDADAGDAAQSDAPNEAQAEAGVDCGYPPVQNEAGCPSSYSHSYGGQSCSPVGLTCAYPGAGDGTSNGCASTAMLFCNGDAGADAGTFTAAQ